MRKIKVCDECGRLKDCEDSREGREWTCHKWIDIKDEDADLMD